MYFVLVAKDKPTGDLRAKRRLAHLEFIADKQSAFKFGGPLLDEAGKVAGSLMILEMEDRAALDRYMAQDPYFKDGGIFDSVEVYQTRWIVPEENPGALKAEIERQKAADRQRGGQ
ncbi:MAG TPA: YciI family protein [Ferrovibrio sp.]|uniref:YciI family protein n=1 Tax=Ferrovibrio sp. TaxID=1917215 RepID=UPI002ED077EB